MLDASIPRKEMAKLLYLCTKHVHFSHGGRINIQIGGIVMGSPLGPVLANVFMTKLENVMIHALGKTGKLEKLVTKLETICRRYIRVCVT